MKRFNITVNGKAYDVQVEELAHGAAPTPVAAAPAAPVAAPVAPAAVAAPAAPAAAPAGVQVNSPMPGNILDVKVAPGQAVKAGQALVVLEAMKMENDIVAPQDGNIVAVQVKKGDSVNAGDVLVVIG